MAERLDAYAKWLVENRDRQGDPEFETVKDQYLALRSAGRDAPVVADSPEVVEAPQVNAAQMERAGKEAIVSGVDRVRDALSAGSAVVDRVRAGSGYRSSAVQAPIAGAPRPGTPEFTAWEKGQEIERRKRHLRERLYSFDPKDSSGPMQAAVIGGASANRMVEPYLRPFSAIPTWGPIINAGGQIAAGALGAGSGVYTFYGGADALKDFGIDTPYKRVGAEEAARRGLTEARDDAAFAGALGVLGRSARAGGRKVMDMVTGVGPRQRAYAGEVKSKFGVGLSNVNLSERPLIKGFNRIVGMMPLIGAPAAKARERVATEFLDAKDRLFIRSGPSLSKPEAATYLVQAAKKRYGAMSGRANKLYGNYRALAEEAGEIFPTEHLQLRAVETLDEATKAMARNRETGELIVPKSLREAWKTYNDAVEDAVMYGDRVTLPQLETIEGSLYAAANQIKEQAKGGGKAAAALQNAIMNMAREAQGAQRLVDPEGAGAEALAALNKADDFYSRMMGVFETKAAQAVTKTDPNALARGPRKFKRPTFNEDEVFDMMFSTKSADAQKQLLDVVGRPAYQKAVQTHVSNAFSKSITDKGFNSKQFLELTGLGNTGVREGTENAMNAAYRLAGVDRGRLELFADFAAKITRSDVPDMSTFVARRGMLGGIRSAARAFVPGAMVAGGAATAMGPVTGLGLTLGLRYVTGVMNKPVYKQLMEDIARNAPGSQGFRNSMTRLLRLGLEDLGAEGDAAVDEGRRMAHEAYQGLRAP